MADKEINKQDQFDVLKMAAKIIQMKRLIFDVWCHYIDCLIQSLSRKFKSK